MDSSLGVYSSVIAMPGIRVYLDLDLTLWINKSMTSSQETTLRNEIYAACSNYIISNVESRKKTY